MRWRRRLELAGLWLACGVLAHLAGVAVTGLYPATVQTRLYQAEVRLTADPRDLSALHTRTVFGDINLDFAGFAPAVIAHPQVRPAVTEVLSRPGASIRTLQPGPAELEAAIRDAAVDTLARYAVGALIAATLLVIAYVAFHRRRPRWRNAFAAATAAVVAAALTTLSLWATYQPSRLSAYSTTGLIGTVEQNRDLLASVEERANQTAPYLRNILALSDALQERYAPTSLDAPAAVRILLVSDVHGGNQYPLMRAIVEEEGVDAVVDAGDLLNFGTVQEGQVGGIFTGIRTLGVPYLFVKGNHDARSATDDAVLRRLDAIDNVQLLHPEPATYAEVDIRGVRFAGFNDPRWFGDDNKDNAGAQAPAREAWLRTWADRTEPDVVVAHEPGALSGIDRGGLLVHGHLHSQQLEGNRLGVGTFTGGGPFSHYIEGQDEELSGQPSAFDVLTFGADCRLVSVTRYQYRNVIEGRPAYDRVSLVNGARVDGRPPEEGRSCGEGHPAVSVTSVPAVPAPGFAPTTTGTATTP